MTKPDPSFCFSPKTQGITRMGSGQVRKRGLVLRPQTHQVSAGDFCARREEQLSCDNTSTTAKFSRLFSVIQMLGKYNLIISCRGKSSAESLVLLCPFSSPHPAAAAHPETLQCHHCLVVLAGATSSVPVLSSKRSHCSVTWTEHLPIPFGGAWCCCW